MVHLLRVGHIDRTDFCYEIMFVITDIFSVVVSKTTSICVIHRMKWYKIFNIKPSEKDKRKILVNDFITVTPDVETFFVY